MKRILSRLLIVLVCIAAGWVAGYLNIPYVEYRYSFWVGVLAIIVFVGLFYAFFWVWDRKISVVLKLRMNKKYSLVLGAGTCALMVLLFLVQVQKNKRQIAEIDSLGKQLEESQVMADSLTAVNGAVVLKEVLADIRSELVTSRTRSLSDRTVQKIMNVNEVLRPYKKVKTDSMVLITSPERGQLFSYLALSEMDSNSFSKIKEQVSFAQSYLPNAQLKGLDLSGVDLSGSYLANVDFTGSDLSEGRFNSCNMESAILHNVRAKDAFFQHAWLMYAAVNKSQLINADISESNLQNVTAIDSDFSGARIFLSDLTNGVFSKSIFVEALLAGCKLSHTNFKSTRLTSLRLSESYLEETDFANAVVDSNWFSNLVLWKLDGRNQFKDDYQIIKEVEPNDSIFRLVKKKP